MMSRSALPTKEETQAWERALRLVCSRCISIEEIALSSFSKKECGSRKPTVKPEFARLGELAWVVLEQVPKGQA
jgi:hypothetical protein